MTVAELSPVEKAVQMYSKGSTPKQVSDALGVPEATARTWKSRHFQNENSVSNIETEIQELKRKVETDETQIQELKRKIQTDETEFQKLKRKIQTDETEFQKLKRKIQTDETEIQKLETQIQANETEIQKLKRKMQADETEFQKLKRSESELTNEAKLLRGQIKGLEQQIEFRDKSTQSGLNNQEKLLTAQIVDLKAQLLKVEAKLDKAQAEERQHAEAVKVAHEKAIEAKDAGFEKEKRQIEAKHQAALERLELEKQSLLDDKEKAIEAANEAKRFLLNDKSGAIETLQAEHETRIAELMTEHEAALKVAKDYAAKWEGIEKSMSKELFLRRLGFAFAIVTPLIIVQGIEVGLFAQLAYKDASYSGDWIKVVGAILSFGFQGTGLFLTINRNKVIRGIKIGVDEDGNPIYKKDERGEIMTETSYDMTTMKVLCCVDFLINCFVLFGNATTDLDYGAIARLVCFSMLTPLGIFFTSEILLNIIDKKEKLIQ